MAASSVPPRLGCLLDSQERERHGRLLRPEDQRSYLAAHVLARLALSLYLEVDPSELRIGRTCHHCESPDHGKPVLFHPESDLELSLSHSGGRVAVAVARAAAVGVDVEEIKPARDYSEIAAFALSASERNTVLAMPPEGRAGAVVRYWTRKEAALKALGLGLSSAPSELTVTGPHEPARVLGWAGGPDRVELVDLEAGPGFASSVALVDWDGDRVVERDGEELLHPACGLD